MTLRYDVPHPSAERLEGYLNHSFVDGIYSLRVTSVIRQTEAKNERLTRPKPGFLRSLQRWKLGQRSNDKNKLPEQSIIY